MSHKQGHFFIIMWVAWGGKWTLRVNLEKNKIEWLEFIKSYVCRPMREGEVDWDVYNFTSEEDFAKMIENNELLEYALVHKLAYYGTRKVDVIDNGIEKWKIVMKEMEIQWYRSICEEYPELRGNITSIFLSLSVEKLRERVKLRWQEMSQEELSNREESLEMEIAWAQKFCDYIIDTGNMTPQEVLDEVVWIIEGKRK